MLPYFVLQTPVPIRHTNTHFNTEPVQGVGHAATAAATATKTKKAQVAFRKKKKKEGICGLLFWLVGQMPQRWVKKENMQRLPCRFPCVGWREKESPQQIYGGGKRCLAPTAANLRLGGSAVALLQLRANSHTLKRRRADSSRPLER